jgi:tetratricopeptide (TPR) repeat protein
VKIERAGMVVALALIAGLSGCGGVSKGTVFERNFWTSGPVFGAGVETELGIAAMATGSYGEAESHFNNALAAEPRNVHALLGLAMLFQNSGRVTKARELYEAVLAIRPSQKEQMVIWNNLTPKPVSEIASVNLALLDSNGVLRGLGSDPGTMGNSSGGGQEASGGRPTASLGAPAQRMTSASASTMLSAAPTGSAMIGRPAPAGNRAVLPNAVQPRFADADSNIVSRFKTMKTLLDQGLITQDEFNTRRRANIGALLPQTSPPPAAGLDRPVPSTEQISGRLRSIGRALEMRAMTVGQHASERSMILDALMPAAPIQVANPLPPARGLMEAADSVRRIEMLKASSYISNDEYSRERAAIETAMQPKPVAQPSVKVSQAKMNEKANGQPTALSGPQPAVHLASYRSQKAANRGWAQLRRAYRSLLQNLKPEISRVRLGPKGTYFRLKAGPLKNQNEAVSICRKLKAGRQFCEPSVMGAG